MKIFVVLTLINLVLCLISAAVNIRTFSVNRFINSSNNRIKILEKENEKNRIELEEYRLLDKKYEENRIFRHDLKEHISVLKALISDNNSQAASYLRDIEKKSDETDFIKYTDNSVLNILLEQKNKECRDKGIKLHVKTSNPCLDFFTGLDIVALFSNLLNNAIEACTVSANKEIFLDLYTGNNVFTVIKMENSADKKPAATEGIPATNKSDKKNHGQGFKSIRNTLKKYNGDMHWIYDENNKIFRTTILINTEALKTNIT